MSWALCLIAGGAVAALLPGDAFTLIWTHSTAKTEWREDYVIAGGALRLTTAEVEGSSAGMEPGYGAERTAGGWRYRPDLPLLTELTLARSPFSGDYRLCWAGGCAPLTAWVPDGAGPVTLRACPLP